ncbi:MAG: hypothetical protein EBV25_05900 [Methylophilaceae bacterium]|nr:hypothetical protein [Methylophilaceae bacterium]
MLLLSTKSMDTGMSKLLTAFFVAVTTTGLKLIPSANAEVDKLVATKVKISFLFIFVKVILVF